MVRPGGLVQTLILGVVALTVLPSANATENKTIVTYPSAFAVSQPLSELPIEVSPFAEREMPEPGPAALRSRAVFSPWQLDSALQMEVLPEFGASEGVHFEGITANGWAPSDSNLAVGRNHLVEVVNVRLAVYDKRGAILSGPTNIMSLFKPIGGDCASVIYDPIVLYDRQADRWVIAGVGAGTTYAECVAVSKTNNPTGSYALYSYGFGTTLNDYDKLSVWATASNSAYLATYNIFAPTGFRGADLCGFNRAKMLAGNAKPAMLCKMTPSSESSYLPSDMDGPTPPADGTPGLFLTWQDNSPGKLYLRKLTLNFTSGTAALSSPTAISVANAYLACAAHYGVCIPQAGTTQQLDSLGDRLMYRFAIRHFLDHDRAVVNHAVANGSRVAVRWYELYNPAGSVTLKQQGTYAPDSTYRWMASAAEDKKADIAIGYSVSSSSIHPGIRFTGRRPSDPAGSLESEISSLEGTGSQSKEGLFRWGDYTAMQVDPSDDCTFWYVNQYEPVSGAFNWSTHIGSFAFTGCLGGPELTLLPTSLTFSAISVGTTSSAKTVTASNTGGSTLDFTKITISGDFHIKSKTCGSTLAAGASCTVKVTFAPTQTGLRTGNLTFSDNAPGSPQKVPLSGKGL